MANIAAHSMSKQNQKYEPMMVDTVVTKNSDGVENDDDFLLAPHTYIRRRRYGLLILILMQAVVVVISIVAGAVLFSRNNNDNSDTNTIMESDSAVHHRLDFVAIGDWGVVQYGEEDSENKTMTARTMDAVLQSFYKKNNFNNNTSSDTSIHDKNEGLLELFDPQFIIGTGDNFYPNGLELLDNEFSNFPAAFSEPYSNVAMPWYNVLGNHDYHSIHVRSEINDQLRQIDDRWICHQDYTVLKNSKAYSYSQTDTKKTTTTTTTTNDGDGNAFMVQFFFIDTNPFVQHYQERVNGCLNRPVSAEADETQCDAHYNGMKVLEPAMEIKLRAADLLLNMNNSTNNSAMNETAAAGISEEEKREIWMKYTSRLAVKLDEALLHSDAHWKIVVGHHPFFSQGKHGDTVGLKDSILPILHKHNIRLYLNGHDHTLQHIQFESFPTHFVTTGSGAKTNFEMPNSFFGSDDDSTNESSLSRIHDSEVMGMDLETPTVSFFSGANGFTLLSIEKEQIKMQHIDGGSGQVVHDAIIPFTN